MRIPRPLALALALAAALVAAAAAVGPLAAQRPTVSVRVRVVDTAGAPVEGAEIAIAHDLQRTLARGVTDARGLRVLTFARNGDDYDVTARRIGFLRADRYVVATKIDTASVDIVLVPAPQTLAPVTVTAQQDLERKSYHVDADDIANSKRLIMTGMDVLTKMKPDIITGRAPGCGVREIWVNGRRVVNPPDNAVAEAHIPKISGSAPIVPSNLGYRGQTTAMTRGLEGGSWFASAPGSIWSIMWSIKPEHIQEMNYKDCMDISMPGLHQSSALFVVLKPGVAFEAGRGSYVIGTPKPPVRTAAALRYRARVLGVFDEGSGEPVSDVQIVDDSSGTMALTTETGTVSLVFLPEGASSITIRKPGFVAQHVDVSISPADTLPITLILSKSPP